MEQFFHQISLWIGLVGGFIVWLLGGWDAMLIVLTVVVGLDYLMGVLCSIYRHRLCSDIGYKGIVKKVVVFIIVAAASAVQTAVQKDIPLREMVIVFFVANECISILEHAAQMGMRMPERFKQVLLKLRGGETGKSDKEDSNGKTGN